MPKDDLRFYQQLFDASADAVVVVDPHGVIRLANPQTATLFGWEMGDIIGRPVELFVPLPLKDTHVRRSHRVRRGPCSPRPMGATTDLRAVRADGSEFPVDISLTPVEAGGEPMVAAAIRDVSERTATQAQLVESENASARAWTACSTGSRSSARSARAG